VNLVIVPLFAQLLVVDGSVLQTPPTGAETEAAERSLLLLRLVSDALENNLTLRSARANTKSVETGVGAAKSAFDPFLQVSPSYARADQKILAQPGLTLGGIQTSKGLNGGINGTLPWSTSWAATFDGSRVVQSNSQLLAPPALTPTANTSLTFTLAQPLLKGFGPRIAQAPVDLASLGAQSAQARLVRQEQQTVADVESSYWTLGLAEAIERIARASSERARELLTRNQKMRQLSLISEVDLITSRRGLQQRLTTLTEAVRQRKDAAERLIFLVYGQEAEKYLDPELRFRTEPPPSASPALPPIAILEREALDSRSDLRAARIDLSQSEVSKRVSGNALLPDARLQAAYAASVFGSDDIRLFSTSRPGDLESNEWRVGLNFSYPLGNRAAKAADAKAKYDLEATQSALASVEQQVRSEVRSAARGIQANLERVEQARLSLEYAQQQYEAGQKQLQLGLIDSFRLLQMDEDVSTAALVYEQTRYDLAQSNSSFELAMGSIRSKYASASPSAGSNPAP